MSSSVQPPISRRNFLVTSSLAGLGLLLSQPKFAIAQAGRSPNSEINVAIIGLGVQGRILLDSLLNIPGLRFRAVCDIWKYAQQYGVNKLKKAGHDVKAYTDIEDLLDQEKDLDAAIIATPDFWHAPHTIACLKAGLHVYCEKMMSNTIEGARAMVKAMDESGKLLQIGHQRRSNPRYLHILNNLIRRSRVVGRFTAANGQWNRAVTEDFGWPKAYEIPADTLKRYGYRDMHQFRNWRWFRDLSGGPISDLGAHQIDIFNWFFGTGPRSVMAAGGIDYYKTHEHYDNVMVIYEYALPEGVARAFYQVQTTTSSGGGYFENFMGDEGSIVVSENPKLTKIYREERAPDWEHLVAKNYLRKTAAPAPPPTEAKADIVDVRETKALSAYEIPVVLNKPIHQPHLENFFAAIAGQAKLNCDGRHAFESEVSIFRVNEAVAAQKMLFFTPEDYAV